MSNLQDKSKSLQNAANLLHDSKLYPAVAHSAYYSCVQLMKHIWLYSIRKTEEDIKNELKEHNQNALKERKKTLGTHEFLINNIANHIKQTKNNASHTDFSLFNNNIWQLKELRTNADYSDSPFSNTNSSDSIKLSQIIMQILQKY